MKKIITALIVILSVTTIQGQEIHWISIEEAISKQKRNPKPIFMNVYTDWYNPCKMLDKDTFQDAEVIEFVNKNYYAVRFNAEGNNPINFKGMTYDNPSYDPNRKGRNSAHEFTKYLRVPEYPSMYIINKNGDVEQTIAGYKTHEELLKILK